MLKQLIAGQPEKFGMSLIRVAMAAKASRAGAWPGVRPAPWPQLVKVWQTMSWRDANRGALSGVGGVPSLR